MLLFEEMILPYALNKIQGGFFRSENGRHSVVEIFLGNFVVLVRSVDFLIKDIFKVGFKKRLAEVNLVWHTEFIKFVELDKSHT